MSCDKTIGRTPGATTAGTPDRLQTIICHLAFPHPIFTPLVRVGTLAHLHIDFVLQAPQPWESAHPGFPQMSLLLLLQGLHRGAFNVPHESRAKTGTESGALTVAYAALDLPVHLPRSLAILLLFNQSHRMNLRCSSSCMTLQRLLRHLIMSRPSLPSIK